MKSPAPAKSHFSKKRVLLSFTGYHDPIGKEDKGEGPILTAVRLLGCDVVFLFATPKMQDSTLATQEAIKGISKNIETYILDVPIQNPTNHLEIMQLLVPHTEEILSRLGEQDYYVALSSGTPAMHVCWVMLVAGGRLPAKVIQTIGPKDGGPKVEEVDLTVSGFPSIYFAPWRKEDFKSDERKIEKAEQVANSLGLVVMDPVYTRILDQLVAFADKTYSILIIGETGTGKEMIAKFIHQMSGRPGPFTPFNAANAEKSLFDSTLFGHVRGAFTDARQDRMGLIENSNHGTLLLDEIGKIPLDVQAKLLRVLQDKIVRRMGDNKEIEVDVRFLGATDRDIEWLSDPTNFDMGLYHRFAFRVEIPPLRRRRPDIPLLAQKFLARENRINKREKRLNPDAMNRLLNHAWPGNVRELEIAISMAWELAPDAVIGAEHLRLEERKMRAVYPEPAWGDKFDAQDACNEYRAFLFERALEYADGNQSKAAELLKVSPQAVSQFIKSIKVKKD